jgi:membrane protease YdiL (CAAX protease family)
MVIVFLPIPVMTLLTSGLEEGTAASGILDSLAIVISMVLATVMLRRCRAGWSAMGMGRPRSWLITIGLAVGVFVLTLVVAGTLQAVLMTLMPPEDAPDLSRFEALEGNLPMLLVSLAGVWVTAAFGEEMLVRGFMMNRLAQVFGATRAAWIGALVVSSVLFGLMHVYQGPVGVILTGSVGLLFGAVYLLVRRNLWVTILAHGFVDTLSFVAIYAGLANTGGG